VSFNRLLADAEPAKAAQAALVMARATVNEPGVSAQVRRNAQQLIDMGVDELTDVIRARRVDAVIASLDSDEEPGEAVSVGSGEEEQAVPEAIDPLAPLEGGEISDEKPPMVRRRWKMRMPSGRGRAAIDREQAEAIREWARRNGHKVSTRGRIPADVVDLFIREGGQ
jgi:hypothetical protein